MQVEAILKMPISFRDTSSRGSSNGVDYVLEVADDSGYRWAIRPMDDSRPDDYMAIVNLVDSVCSIDSDEWKNARTKNPR
jgi:hypothetical protein